MERLKNRPVLLTGATGSIGSATARLLASGGAHLYLTGRNREKLGSLARELQLPDQQWFADGRHPGDRSAEPGGHAVAGDIEFRQTAVR